MHDLLDILHDTRSYTERIEPTVPEAQNQLGGIFDFLKDPLDIFGGRAAKEKEEKEAEEKKRKEELAEKKRLEAEAGPSLIICPDGKKPNPKFSAILALPPEQRIEARKQAIAAGVEQCVPEKDVKKKKKKKCHIVAGPQKFPCSAAGMVMASQMARAMNVPVFMVKGSQQIPLSSMFGPQTPVGGIPATPLAAMGVPAVPAAAGSTPGTFTCPTGLVVARNEQNQVVCINSADAPKVAAAAKQTAAQARAGRAVKRRPTRPRKRPARTRGTRGRRGLRDAGPVAGGLDPTAQGIKALQMLLRAAGARDRVGELPKVSGMLTTPTVDATNFYLRASGRLPITPGEILVNLDAILAMLQRDTGNLQGCECPGGNLGDAGIRRVVMNSLRRDLNAPTIPGYFFRRMPPKMRFSKKPVRSFFPDMKCPPGYFISQQGCTKASTLYSGFGPVPRTRGQAMNAGLRKFHLAPNFPRYMMAQTVPPLAPTGVRVEGPR